MASQQIRSIDATDHTSDEISGTASTLNEATEVLESDYRTLTVAIPVERTVEVDDAVDFEDARSVELSEPFVARWTVLISTTNWEKGAIIAAWRGELESQGAEPGAFSDEAWSRRVGGVTSQHVGRLRRVHQRFGQTHDSYAQLYWTHFLAALDWDDAEMWLEGASQSRWSVSQMRNTRWEASGGDPASTPVASDIVSVSTDEDFSPLAEPMSRERDSESSRDMPEGPRFDGPDFGDEPNGSSNSISTADDSDEAMPWEDKSASEPMTSPFASLPVLPVDVADALEQFKLSIIRHRAGEWSELSQDDMLRTLDALRSFTMQ